MPEPSDNNHIPADISVDVLIVGAGFSGICMGIKLLEARNERFPDYRKERRPRRHVVRKPLSWLRLRRSRASLSRHALGRHI